MSSLVLGWVNRHGPRQHGERSVLVALAWRADEAGVCWPSVENIAQRTGLTRRSVQRILRRLEAGGWISVEIGGGGGRGKRFGRSSSYMVRMVEHPPASAEAEGLDGPDLRATQSRGKADLRATLCPFKGDSVSPEYTEEKTKEEETRGRAREDAPLSVEGSSPSAWTPERLLEAVRDAVGVPADRLRIWWRSDYAEKHVWSWVEALGLSPEEVIREARASRREHPKPPDGPKALDRFMEKLAAAKGTAQRRAAARPSSPRSSTFAPISSERRRAVIMASFRDAPEKPAKPEPVRLASTDPAGEAGQTVPHAEIVLPVAPAERCSREVAAKLAAEFRVHVAERLAVEEAQLRRPVWRRTCAIEPGDRPRVAGGCHA